MSRVLVLLSAVAWALAAGFAIFLLLVRSSLFAGVDILFYRGILLCFGSATLVVASLVALSRRIPRIDAATMVAAAMTSLSFNLCFLVLVPVTIDRSISVFLLSQIESNSTGPALDEGALSALFVSDYVGDMGQIQRRVREQAYSGNIVVTRGTIRLTPRGERFLRFARIVACIFGTDPRFVGAAHPRLPAHPQG